VRRSAVSTNRAPRRPTSPHEGERSGADYYESLVREDLAALYVIGRRLGETESTEGA
jgi:hypothetical protein